MTRHRLSTSIAALLLAVGAHAAPAASNYAVLSLVGDKLDVVTYQPAIGSQLDNNSHIPVVLPQDELDLSALKAINRTLKASVPGAQVTLLAASRPEDFADQDRIFSGDRVTLPAEIDAAMRREGATALLLVTKHHGEARLQLADGITGSGRVAGLGFYLDGRMHLKNQDTGARSIGYIAPFVNIDVSLVDLATGTVMHRKTISTGQVIGAYHSADGTNAWDALSGAEKVSVLTNMLTTEVAAAVPALLGGRADTAEAAATAAR